ncbi:hypothetical protein HF086_009557 [Spodoptera exigua]|uniref:Uncharacterized protein n=1 Tax=Spodoptera exigua TaxID=7107 RepID=A0A922SAY4_SPOEX|nr:hypothetical protein HF086_009557 [Spodoptera exigua]
MSAKEVGESLNLGGNAFQEGNDSPSQVSNNNERTVESDMESLFGGDISDDDPTYQPPDIIQMPSEADSNDSKLITLEELLNPDFVHAAEERKKISRRNAIARLFGNKQKPPKDNKNNESLLVAQSITVELFQRCWKVLKPRARWHQRNPETWKVNVVKRQRAEGLPYVTKKKFRSSKNPKPVDCSKCKFECNDKVTDEERQIICRKY